MASGKVHGSVWKLVDTKTGSADIALPASFDELYVIVNGSSIIIPKEVLTSNLDSFTLPGGYFNTGGVYIYKYIGIMCSLTKAYLQYAVVDNVNRISTTKISVYYR